MKCYFVDADSNMCFSVCQTYLNTLQTQWCLSDLLWSCTDSLLPCSSCETDIYTMFNKVRPLIFLLLLVCMSDPIISIRGFSLSCSNLGKFSFCFSRLSLKCFFPTCLSVSCPKCPDTLPSVTVLKKQTYIGITGNEFKATCQAVVHYWSTKNVQFCSDSYTPHGYVSY
ncbi:hypothetical protein AMECASPLE_031388 [Ameca splendens]|uniref:Uncharacterized protein n=1 Tax=Ameca splendens TaxID=208324 RepID=A0ABV0XV78_9TELE